MRAVLSAIVAGSARSKARAFGMKSNADQIRIVAWLARPISSQMRISGWDHVTTRVAMSASSNAASAGVQKLRREIPPRAGWIGWGWPGWIDDAKLVKARRRDG
jgi:hypothetical protein